MLEHVEKQKPILKPGSRVIFGPFADGMTTTVRFINHHGHRLEFATALTNHDGRLLFREAMSVLGCCYVATMIGLTFDLSMEPIDAKHERLAFAYRKKHAGYVAPTAFIFNQATGHLTVRLPKKDLKTKVSHAPTGNLEAIAGILAALHGLDDRETKPGKIIWRRRTG